MLKNKIDYLVISLVTFSAFIGYYNFKDEPITKPSVYVIEAEDDYERIPVVLVPVKEKEEEDPVDITIHETVMNRFMDIEVVDYYHYTKEMKSELNDYENNIYQLCYEKKYDEALLAIDEYQTFIDNNAWDILGYINDLGYEPVY